MGSTVVSSPKQSNSLGTVFVYGSLLADEVVNVILKRVPQSSSATLDGYHRFSIKGRVYPAIIPVQDKKVTGRVLFGLTDPELDILDAFEDIEYERNTVQVSMIVSNVAMCILCSRSVKFYLDGPEKVQTYAYVWKEKADPDLYGSWNYEEWRKVHMDGFLKMTTGFVEEFEGPEAKPRVETYESFYQQSGGNL